VDAKIRRDAPHEANGAQILHDDRVHARAVCGAHDLRPGLELRVEYQGVECEVRFDAARMKLEDYVRQALDTEIVRARAGVECSYSEVHGVRSRGDGRLERGLIAGWR
jgi:hypothetical protein